MNPLEQGTSNQQENNNQDTSRTERLLKELDQPALLRRSNNISSALSYASEPGTLDDGVFDKDELSHAKQKLDQRVKEEANRNPLERSLLDPENRQHSKILDKLIQSEQDQNRIKNLHDDKENNERGFSKEDLKQLDYLASVESGLSYARDNFNRADTNNDGKLSKTEVDEFLKTKINELYDNNKNDPNKVIDDLYKTTNTAAGAKPFIDLLRDVRTAQQYMTRNNIESITLDQLKQNISGIAKKLPNLELY